MKEEGRVLKCAVGCLIPDDKYDPMMEGDVYAFYKGFSVTGGLKYDNPNPEVFTEDNYVLLDSLQHIHDTYYPTTWAQRLSEYADKVGLHWPWGYRMALIRVNLRQTVLRLIRLSNRKSLISVLVIR